MQDASDAAGADGWLTDALAKDAAPDGTPDAAPLDIYQPDFGPKPNLPPAQGCNTGVGWIPKSLQSMVYDDGTPTTSLPKQNWTIAGTYPMNKQNSWEAVRFDLEKPVRVWGFSIYWAGAPTDAKAALKAGLYPDFSNNGFDFWRWQSYWEGSRCAGDVSNDPVASSNGDGWLDYALAEPLEFAQPQLVYVAHPRTAEADPAFALDGTAPENCADPKNCCNEFAKCHSAWNLPDIQTWTMNGQTNFNWNGISSSLDHDFLVRLWVEELPGVAPADKVFAPVDGQKVGNRQAFGDYDGDGDDDLLLPGPQLLRNDGGVYTDVTAKSGLGGGCSGGVWGDFDNDSCPDIFCFVEDYSTQDRLWKGDCKGGFADVTAKSTISGTQTYNTCKDKGNHAPSAGAGWADMDGDGLLDLYVSRFQCWDNYTPYVDTVFHNQGGGVFSDWTGTHGFPDSSSSVKTPSRGIAPVDADLDGDVDLFVNNYVLIRNLYFRNDGGTFVESGQKNGLAGVKTLWGGQTYYGHSIGASFGDLNGDGLMDAVVANLAHPRFFVFSNKTQVLLQDAPGHWTDLQGAWAEQKGVQPLQAIGGAGLRYQETHSVPALGDFDQDGDLDLAISAVYDGRPTDFYWGNGDGSFSIDRLHAGISSRNGWGLAVSDFDNDGDLDLAAQGELLRNQWKTKGHWLQIRLVGDVKSNRMGLGATVRLKLGDKTMIRHVSGGNGQGCQDSATLQFGLGAATHVDSIEVLWIGGGNKTYAGPINADQRLWLTESGKATPGFGPPK